MILRNKLFNNKLPRSINTFIWDVDGTLYRSTDEIFKKMCTITIGYIVERVDEDMETIKKHVMREVKKKRLLGEIAEKDYFLDKHKLAEISENTINKWEFVNKNRKLVRIFDEYLYKYNHSILTNASKRNTEKVIDIIGFSKNHFQSMITKDDMGSSVKPSLNAFEKILNINKIRSDQALMIGDTLTQDIYPAKSLGIYTCYVADNRKENIKEADFIIESPEEIISFI